MTEIEKLRHRVLMLEAQGRALEQERDQNAQEVLKWRNLAFGVNTGATLTEHEIQQAFDAIQEQRRQRWLEDHRAVPHQDRCCGRCKKDKP